MPVKWPEIISFPDKWPTENIYNDDDENWKTVKKTDADRDIHRERDKYTAQHMPVRSNKTF